MSSFLQEKDEEDSKNKTTNKILSLIKNLNLNTNISKLKEINSKCVDLILEDKNKKALNVLKNIESFLENEIMDMKIPIPKKFIIIILHNISCCYEKLKDLDNCILYFEALLYHFDSLLEKQYNISINPEYFVSLIKFNYYLYDKTNLGDLILELRFCAKFHIQFSILLSKAQKHVDSLYHAKIAALICEDNIIKTSYLYQMIKNEFKNNKIKENGSNDELNKIKEQIKHNYKIVFELKKLIKNLRNNSSNSNNIKLNEQYYNKKRKINSVYNNYFKYVNNTNSNISRQSSNYEGTYPNNNDTNNKNCFNSYLDFRKDKINIYTQDKNLLKEIKNIFEKKFLDKDDWIKNLNITTITNLSPLNYEDLDLDSDPKYELLRDSLLEKVIMLTVSYFCLSNELRILSPDKNNQNTNGEYYLYNALYLSLYLLPSGSSIVNFYRSSYYKNYKQCLDIIPEGQIMNYNIDIVKKEIFNENNTDFNDYSYFVKAKKINMIIKEEKSLEKIENQEKEGNISSRSHDYKNKIKLIKKKGIVIHLNNDYNKKKKNFDYKNNSPNNNKKKKIINISDNNIFNTKQYETNSSYVSNSLVSMDTSTEIDIKNIKLIYGNIGLLPNSNFIERANKSKIQKIKAPKFKLNFNKINPEYNMTEIKNSGNKTKDSIKDHINNNIKMKILLNKNKKKFLLKNNFKTNEKMNSYDRKGNLNNNINNNNININKTAKKKINLKINNKNILKNEKLNINYNKITKIFGYKMDYKNSYNNINNMDKKHVFTNQLTNPIKLNNKNKISNLFKYFRIKNISNKDKECLTERLNMKKIIKIKFQ